MVNCGFELAKSGRRVLLVDFDLEAPGVEAFLHPYGARKSKGLVDFITDYRAMHKAPHVSDYVYEAGPTGAHLHLMPAGRRDDDYANRLNRIDWGQLYAEEDGYLLFEDLKAQWENFISPDYVLIDSRTGHTDVAGICTRQLPDSVALLFRLDQQNLEGLQPVVRAIRGEAQGLRNKSIHLHFVPSNVPDIDDENGILDKQLGQFRNTLEHADWEVMLHHYRDLEMLEHKVFAIQRGNSRLSKEYKELTNCIRRQNPEDLDGAKDFLRISLRPGRLRLGSSTEQDSHVEAIAENHSYDPSVLRMLARLREREGRYREAISFLSQAIAAGPSTTEIYTNRAELFAILGNEDRARNDLRNALTNSAERPYSVFRLVSMIQDMEPTLLAELPHSNTLQSLSPGSQIRLAESLVLKSNSRETAVSILREIVTSSKNVTKEVLKARRALCLTLIGDGEFKEVAEILAKPQDIADTFNLAMATWGISGEIDKGLFERVRELEDDEDYSNRDANYEFCLAVTNSVLGDPEAAKARLAKSRNALRDRPKPFSPWRYQFVTSDDFRADLDAADKMLERGDAAPSVFRQAAWYEQVSDA